MFLFLAVNKSKREKVAKSKMNEKINPIMVVLTDTFTLPTFLLPILYLFLADCITQYSDQGSCQDLDYVKHDPGLHYRVVRLLHFCLSLHAPLTVI